MVEPTDHPPEHQQRDPQPPPKRGPIYGIPLEILFKIFQLVAPPRTRDGMYALVELTHVCRFWRTTLISNPQAWATIFATRSDCRSFVKTCLERSGSASLEVTVDVCNAWKPYVLCTCGDDKRWRLTPNNINPCERHFVFESLAETGHSTRIHTLNIRLSYAMDPSQNQVILKLGSCQFFKLPPFQLVNLKWENLSAPYAGRLFSVPPFPPTLRSLFFEGPWHDQLQNVNNLTSLTLFGLYEYTSTEAFQKLMLNNASLEILALKWIEFQGAPNGPPVDLLNLKSFSIIDPPKVLSTLIRVPALRRLSSLVVTKSFDPGFEFCATGDGIEFTARSELSAFAETWKGFTGDARPSIRHVRLENPEELAIKGPEADVLNTFLTDVHTLEVGDGYGKFCRTDFWYNLKKLGPQFKTIRFEFTEDTEPFQESPDYLLKGGSWLDAIVDLVGYRFRHGRPFSLVERMVVSESEEENLQQGLLWRSFYNDRHLDQYIQHE